MSSYTPFYQRFPSLDGADAQWAVDNYATLSDAEPGPDRVAELLKWFANHGSERTYAPDFQWYLASPFTTADPDEGALRRDVNTLLEEYLTSRGVIVYCPCSFSNVAVLHPEGPYTHGLLKLKHCDGLIVAELPGVESSVGVAMELAVAYSRGIPTVRWPMSMFPDDARGLLLAANYHAETSSPRHPAS